MAPRKKISEETRIAKEALKDRPTKTQLEWIRWRIARDQTLTERGKEPLFFSETKVLAMLLSINTRRRKARGMKDPQARRALLQDLRREESDIRIMCGYDPTKNDRKLQMETKEDEPTNPLILPTHLQPKIRR